MTRRSLFLAAVVAAVAAAAAPSIMALLPPSGAIPRWTVNAAADRKGCTAKDFYSMYDGAAPAMLQAGIIAAGARIYNNSTKRVTVDLYRFKTTAQARAYYAKRKAEIAGKPAFAASSTATSGRATAVCGRAIVTYLWGRNCCCTMSVNGKGAEEKASLSAFAGYIARKIAAEK